MKRARRSSGAARLEDDGKGPVEKGAHFFRSLLIDAHGNHINKRNAWANRATVYVHLIPPGAADNAHYRLHIPESAGGQNHLARQAELPEIHVVQYAVRFSLV